MAEHRSGGKRLIVLLSHFALSAESFLKNDVNFNISSFGMLLKIHQNWLNKQINLSLLV